MNSTSVLIILIIVIMFYMPVIRETIVTQPEKVCLDNQRCYLVSSRYGDASKIMAAKLLDSLHNDCLLLVRHMRNNYLWNTNMKDPAVNLRKILAKNLTTRYNADVIVENVPISNTDTSYTIDKGGKLAICLRNKQSDYYTFESYPELQFVAFHELSHIATDVPHHNDDFWVVFKVLLEEAERVKIYTPKNYSINPIIYCGLNVRYNPYFDENINEMDLYHRLDTI